MASRAFCFRFLVSRDEGLVRDKATGVYGRLDRDSTRRQRDGLERTGGFD